MTKELKNVIIRYFKKDNIYYADRWGEAEIGSGSTEQEALADLHLKERIAKLTLVWSEWKREPDSTVFSAFAEKGACKFRITSVEWNKIIPLSEVGKGDCGHFEVGLNFLLSINYGLGVYQIVFIGNVLQDCKNKAQEIVNELHKKIEEDISITDRIKTSSLDDIRQKEYERGYKRGRDDLRKRLENYIK